MEALARNALQLFNIRLTPSQLGALATYERELLEWNAKFNLTAVRTGLHPHQALPRFVLMQPGLGQPPAAPPD